MCARAQGFVSNRDSERNEDRADPLEIVLYAVFVATSARASVAELAEILQARASFALSSAYYRFDRLVKAFAGHCTLEWPLPQHSSMLCLDLIVQAPAACASPSVPHCKERL